MWVSLALKADEFTKGLKQASQQAGGFGKQLKLGLGGVFSGLLKTAGLTFAGIGAAAAAGLGLAVRSAIQTNAQLETTRLQFTTLMGSADQAKQHVADLFEIAERTPFETGPIIEASLKLQTFGGSALNTKDNIILLGDAAAATGSPIDELGFWVGRLYSNLQGGQPFGEAAMRLQELAVLSPQARQEMERLQKAGASASEVFAYFQGDLEKFTGAMEKQAGTWSGLVSTLTDKLSLMAASTFAPVFDAAKESVAGFLAVLDDPAVLEGFAAAADAVADSVTKIGNVFKWAVKDISLTGLKKQNDEMATLVGLTHDQQRAVHDLAQARSGADWLQLTQSEELAYQSAVNDILRQQYGLTIQVAQGYQALGEARMDDISLATEQEVVSREQSLAMQTEYEQSQWLARATDWVRESQDKARAADHARAEELLNVAAQTAVATAAQEAYNKAFVAVQGDYTNKLRGADKPLVTPARDVSYTTGGLSSEQVKLLEQYQDAAAKAQTEIYNLTNGLGTYGMEQDKVNEKVAEAQGELAYYQGLMAPLQGIVGETSTAHQELAVNVGAAEQSMYDYIVQLVDAGKVAPEVAAAYALSTGIMTQAQAEAMLKAVALRIEIEKLGTKLAEGIPLATVVADLNTFIAKINGDDGVISALQGMPPAALDEGLALGAALVTGLQQGVTENESMATEAARKHGEAVIDSMAESMGVQSPSTLTHAMGVDLMVGLENGANQQEPVTTGILNSIGGKVVAGLQAGINGARGLVEAAIKSISDAIPDWLNQFLGIHSPAKVVVPKGRAVGEALAVGIIYSARTLRVALDKLVAGLMETLDLSSQLSQMGSSFAAEFQRRVTDPMAAELSELDTILGEAGRLFDDTMRGLGRDDVFADWADPAQMQTARRQLAELRRTLGAGGDWLGAMQADEALRALDKRNDLNAEYVRQQERLAKLQQAQAELSFLQSQVELIQLIAENADALPDNMLQGLEFGVDADPGKLMDAVTAVLQEQAKSISERLQGSQALGQVVAEGLHAPEYLDPIQQANAMWDTFTEAVTTFAGWLKGRQFKIDIKLGKIPEWAVPGSPLPIHIAWQKFADALRRMDFGHALEQYFAGTVTEGTLLSDFMQSLPESLQGMTGDINDIVFNHLDDFRAYFDAVMSGETDLEELLGAFPDQLQPVVESIGGMMQNGQQDVAAYVEALLALGEAVETTQTTLDLAKGVGSVASGFASYFTRMVLEPLQGQITTTQDMLEMSVSELEKTTFKRFGESLKFPDLANLPTDQAINEVLRISSMLKNTQGQVSPAEHAAEMAQIDAVLDGLQERNRLENEYERQQQRILALEEQRAQLNFLQQQLDLIKLVTESGLDASVLDGMTFGLNADAGQLMDTMTNVMRMLIMQAQDELQMHSPSAVFRDMGQNAMDSVSLGVEERAAALRRSLKRSLAQSLDGVEGPMYDDPSLALRKRLGSGRSIINGGYHVYVYGDDEGALEQLQRQSRAGRGRQVRVAI